MMKKGHIFLVLALLISPAHAQTTIEAGRTPDEGIFYAIDVALDNIALALTFDQAEKSKKGLEIAQERLMEVREMAIENKLTETMRAEEEHAKMLTKAKDSLLKIDKNSSIEEAREIAEIELEIEEHEQKIEEVRGELEIKIEIEGEITPDQQKMIDEVLARMEGKAGEVEIEIENEKGRKKIEIEIEEGLDEDEIEEEMERIEEEAKQKRAIERMAGGSSVSKVTYVEEEDD